MINIKKNSLEMLRGKVVEDAIRQSFFGIKPHDIKFAQRYAHDDFIIKSQNYPKSLVNKSLTPINNLVSSGIRALLSIGLKNIKEQKERYYVDSKLVIPDFIAEKIIIDNIEYKNVILELKCTRKKNKTILSSIRKQCQNYSKLSNIVVLFYLYFSEDNQNHGIFEVKYNFYIFTLKNKFDKIFNEKCI